MKVSHGTVMLSFVKSTSPSILVEQGTAHDAEFHFPSSIFQRVEHTRIVFSLAHVAHLLETEGRDFSKKAAHGLDGDVSVET